MYTATVVPYRVAFIDNTTMEWFVFELLLDGLFVIDLFINFISALEISDEEVDTRFKAIAINYVKTWFFLDFIGKQLL